MKYIKKIYESVDIIPEFEHLLKGHEKIVISSLDVIKLKIKIGKLKIINHEKSSYYQYKGEIFEITPLNFGNTPTSLDWFDIKIFYDQDVLIKELEDSISKYENKIIEMEDAIQKIKHGGDE